MRLIDAGALRKQFEELYNTEEGYDRIICRIYLEAIDDSPTIDAVEVVRCKDCKNCDFAGGYAYCLLRECGTDENGYCSDGEREV